LGLTALALVRRPNNQIDTWRAGVYSRWLPVAEPAGPEPVPQFLLEVAEAPRATALGGDNGPHRQSEELLVRATGYLSESRMADQAREAVAHMFGFDVDLEPFHALAAEDERLAPLARSLMGLRPPRYPGLFQSLLNAVPCQQVTLVLGLSLLERLARELGPRDAHGALVADSAGPLALPDAAALRSASQAELTALGLSGAKARTLRELAQACGEGRLDLAALSAAPSSEVSAKLQVLYGVGRWTAEYVLLRGLGRLDVFPYGDSGARNGLARFLGESGKPSYDWVAETVRAWQPYAGFVYLHLLVSRMLESGTFESL
jgi:DNA-3-methyladenine glycosylase II